MSNIVTLTSSEQLKQRQKEMQEKHQQQQQQQPQAGVAAPQQAQGRGMTIFKVKKMTVDEEMVTRLLPITVDGTDIYDVDELKAKKTTTEHIVTPGAPGGSGDGSNTGAEGK